MAASLLISSRYDKELGDEDVLNTGTGSEANKSETKAKLLKGAPPPPAGQILPILCNRLVAVAMMCLC